MARMRFAVVGGGNAGFGLAGDLALRGFEVRLFDLPQFEGALEPIRRQGGIRVRGVRGEGLARLRVATTDPAEAVRGADMVLVAVPAYGQASVASVLGPHLHPDQTVVLMPGSFGGALVFLEVLRAMGFDELPVVAECSSFVFACKKDGPGGVWIRGLKRDLPVAAVPAAQTGPVAAALREVYRLAPAPNVLFTSLNNINHVAHPAQVLMNAGRIESMGGDWSFDHEGFTPSVGRVTEAVDEERLSVVRRLGLQPVPLLEWYVRFYGHQGVKGRNLYEATHTSPVWGPARAPDTLEHRYLTEDLPFGLVPISELGRRLGVDTPVMDSVITLAGAALGRDLRREGRSLQAVGLAGLDRDAMIRYCETGRR
ncbi:MAG: NAD/NADP octopine/nopaline dehydrogenase family protein [Firmicutes bacterium]|nr:NAD/NADP octopine/nopaline dehydrogenase family protein [Bacillota bacterium]